MMTTWERVREEERDVLDSITVHDIWRRFRNRINAYRNVLTALKRSTLDESIENNFQHLNRLDDEIMLLISFAKVVAKSEQDAKRIKAMEKDCDKFLCVQRDAVVLTK